MERLKVSSTAARRQVVAVAGAVFEAKFIEDTLGTRPASVEQLFGHRWGIDATTIMPNATRCADEKGQ